MRAIWKGSISFGLVNVPTSIYSATHSHDLPLHQVHSRDGGRIRYQRRCEVCGEVVEWQEIDKAYDDGERTVIITDEDFAELPTEKSREIQVRQFVPSNQVDPIMLDKTYYLAPSSETTKPYELLRRTLDDTERTAIVTFTMRSKTRLAALRVRDDVLVLQTMLWHDEVREADFPQLEQPAEVTEEELDMSAKLVEAYATDFDPGDFTDSYQQQLRELVAAKLERGEETSSSDTFEAAPAEEGGEVVDLMEALRRSVDESRSGSAKQRGSGSGSTSGQAKKSRSDSAGSKQSSSKKGGTTQSGKKSGSKQGGKQEQRPAS